MNSRFDPMPERVDDTPITAQLCFALYSTSLTMTKAFKPLLAGLGLTYPQYVALLALDAAPEPLTVSSLGDQLFLDSGTLTPLLKRMESAGLILRRRSTHDERQVELTVTEAGRALSQRARAVPLQVAPHTGCSAGDRAGLVASLKGVRSSLAQHLGEAG